MNVSCKIIIRNIVTMGTIAATIILMGDEITTAILYSKYFGFIRSIPFSMGWIIFALAAIWLTCRLKGYYKRLDHPFFYASFIYWFFFFFGGIDTKLGLNLAMGIVASPVASKILASIIKRLVKFGCKTSRQAITLYIKTCRHLIKNETLRQKVIINNECWFVKATKKRINNKTPKNKSILKYDHFEKGKPLHEGRTEIVDLITSEVKKLYNSKHSFTIGLEGGWGSGKSTLLNVVIEQLKGNKDDHELQIEVVEFSPWAFPEGKNLSVEFLYEIRRVLIKHSFRARFVVNSYINVLTGSYNLGPLRMITSLFFPRESLTDVKRKLSEIICHHKLKLVVVIDDLDRLDTPEIAEVFKMLRNTGELANSIYLVAYDRHNIERMDEFCNGFLDKIINMELDLNPFESVLLLDSLKNEVEKIFENKPHYTENPVNMFNYSSSYSYSSNFDKTLDLLRYPEIVKDIANPRDIVRLTNSIKTKVELLDSIIKGMNGKLFNKNFIIFLEIIKSKNHKLYSDLKNQSIYKDNYSDILNETYITKNRNKYKDILVEYLTPSKDSKYIPRISLRDYFAASSNQMDVTSFLGSFLNEERPQNSEIENKLKEWKGNDILYSWALGQIPLVIKTAEDQGKSDRIEALVVNIITNRFYKDNSLIDITTTFLAKHATMTTFQSIDDARTIYNQGLINSKFNHFDFFFNCLLMKMVDLKIQNNFFDVVLLSQESRLGTMLMWEKFNIANDIICINGTEENHYTISPKVLILLTEFAAEHPYIFFTELAFYSKGSNYIFAGFQGLLFPTHEEMISFVDGIGCSESIPQLKELLAVWNDCPRTWFTPGEEVYDKYIQFVNSLPKTSDLTAPVKRSVLAPL